MFNRYSYYLQGMLTTSILLACCFVFIWGWFNIRNPKLFPFRHISVVGQFSHVSKVDLEAVIQNHLNGGFFMLNVSKMREAIQSVPWIDHVEIQRMWPDSLKVRLSEQQAIARWGKNGLINDRFEIFTPSVATSTSSHNLPMLWGPKKYLPLMSRYYVQLNAMLKTINLSIMVLTVNERQNWRLRLNNGIEIILGQDDILERCQRLIRLYPRIVRANAADVIRIDLRYPNGLAVEWKMGVSSSSST